MSQQSAADSIDFAAVRAHVADVVTGAKTSFYWAMRLLPAEKRRAMFAVYAFCRVVDDIADGDLPRATKLTRLQAWRVEIDRLYAGDPRDPIAGALLAPVRMFGLRREDFLAIIDGMEMDAGAAIVAPSFDVLRLYCDRVAGAVGRLCVRIFGAPDDRGIALARSLGLAVQLTNLLRDLGEDADLGRLYLPRELLDKHAIPDGPPQGVLRHPHLPALCRDLAAVAERSFEEAAGVLAVLPRRDMKPARLILAVYRRLLWRLRQAGFARPDERIGLSKAEKLWLVLRHGIL